MTALPAICDHCGAIFLTTSLIEIGGATDLTISNVGVSCPICGGMARIPDGVYNAIGDTIQIAATSPTSAESLRRLQRVLQEARRTGADARTIARRIEAEAPEFRTLASAVSTRSGRDLYDWIVLILLVATFLIGNARDALQPDQTVTPEIVEQIIRKAIESAQPSASPGGNAPYVREPKTGRNEPCPCGSGKKYKRCHGQ